MRNKGLTAIPWDAVDDSVKVLDVASNLLETIAWVPDGKSLTTLKAGSNFLVEFPDLINISLTLELLNLRDNRISYIYPASRMTQLVVVKKLVLGENQIVALPDAAEFPPMVSRIPLAGNNMTTLPNFCMLNSTQRLEPLSFCFATNRFICDKKMIWATLAYKYGSLVPDRGHCDPIICSEPTSFEGRMIQNFSVEELLNQG